MIDPFVAICQILIMVMMIAFSTGALILWWLVILGG